MPLTVTDWTVAPSLTEHGSHEHGLDTIVGYSVVRTQWDPTGVTPGIVRTQIYVYDGAAMHFARVDIDSDIPGGLALYACGCRSDRVSG